MTKGWAVAALATLLAACSTDDTADRTPAPGKIEVAFRTAMPESRAQISVDETAGRFTGAWEETDVMTVYANGETAPFTYTADGKVFTGQLTDATQDWTYQALYPHVEGAEGKVPFGAVRTQKGDNFNSAYDPLVSESVSHAASAPGKTPGGDPVTFELSRLTSILALTFTVSDAAIAAEKVQSVKLTADGGEIIAAETFDIDRSAKSGALAAAGRSSAIALIYEIGSEPAAASFKAYFNIPAGEYGKLTAEVATENHTARIDLTSGVVLVAGELAYATYAIADADWTAPAAAPTMEWVGHTPDADGTYEPEEIEKGMSVVINLQAAAGIEEFVITAESAALASFLPSFGFAETGVENVLSQDIASDNANSEIWKVLGLSGSPKGSTEELNLNLSGLVPIIPDLPNPEGTHKFTVKLTDALGRSIERTLTFFVPEPEEATPAIVYNGDADLWQNTATFTLSNIPQTASSIAVKYKAADETVWHDAVVGGTTATAGPEWTGPYTTVENSPNTTVTPYYRKTSGTGITKGKSYEYKLVVDGTEYAGDAAFTPEDKNNGEIPSLDNKNLSCYDWDACTSDDTWWASGNCITPLSSFYSIITTCCKHENNAAYLVSGLSAGFLSAGNLYTGKFKKEDTLKGVASFGIKYSWKARPAGIKFLYYGAVAQGTLRQKHGTQVTSADNDYARVFVAVIDWTSTRNVSSGTSAPTGVWDPETVDSSSFEPAEASTYGGGKVIGYASYWIDKNNMPTAFTEKELTFNWYDKTAKPSAENLSLIISCASNAYGDYMCGYDGNYMYVKDFEWVY